MIKLLFFGNNNNKWAARFLSTLISSYRIAAVWCYVWPNYGVRINISLKIIHYIMITLFRLLSYNSHR